ncbi:copper amine oxidase [Kalaharituber pfeilii]|nr:copper amine oxidase [Kalaharituber pfeilii]
MDAFGDGRPYHPFSPLNAREITLAGKILRSIYPPNIDLQFKAITLHEPAKEHMLAWMNGAKSVSRPPRMAYIPYYIRGSERFFEAIVNLEAKKVESNIRLSNEVHGSADIAEIAFVERLALEDESVKKEIEKLKLPEGTIVVCDPWIYGSDGDKDTRRQFQCFFYARPANEPDSCHYALPLAISPVIDIHTKKVTRIDALPTGVDFTTAPETQPWKPQPTNEYLPEYQNLRTDLKPLQVVQPKGASFTVTSDDASGTGKIMNWQKWRFRIGFNSREGMVLYDVTYDNRSLFYRLSLSDMNIPYGDPRPPYHKKAAFDFGDVGAGLMANNLTLGCDCLGAIHYLSGYIADDRGLPFHKQNCICIHEQDAGIGWKHTNYRTGRAALVRNRELVVQSIITVSNYEYILAWIFNQAGEITYEVRATGILSTCPIDSDIAPEDVPAWGTVVHPGVLAQHHQHIFSLRVDPAVDGNENRLIYEEATPLPRDPKTNPHGTGYVTKETVITESCGMNTDTEKNRRFMIQNATKKNPINGKPVSYKIVVPPFQKILADKESWHYRRAEFADQAIYVTKYRDGELYAAGKFTNQSRGGDGVRTYASRKENVVDTDIVVWVQFGLNHIPRIEDFPVMPVETLRVSLKPVNFFTKNPALDVPPSTQQFNRSTLLSLPVGTCPLPPQTQLQVKANGKLVTTSSTAPITAMGKTLCCTSTEVPIEKEDDSEKGSVRHKEVLCECGSSSVKEGEMHGGDDEDGEKLGFRKKVAGCCNVI